MNCKHFDGVRVRKFARFSRVQIDPKPTVQFFKGLDRINSSHLEICDIAFYGD